MSIDRTADLEIIAKYAGKTSSTYRYIEQDFRALDQRAEATCTCPYSYEADGYIHHRDCAKYTPPAGVGTQRCTDAMSIDPGKVLAVVEEMTAPLVSYKFTPSQQAHITSWANKLRALAQPAEAVEGDLDLSKLEDRARRGEALAAEVNDVLGMAQHGNDAAQGAVAWRFWMDSSIQKPGWSEWSADSKFRLLCDSLGYRAEFAYPTTHPQATPRADALADIPSSLLSVPDWAIAAAYRAAVSRLVPDARMSALAFASEVTVAADHEWHSRLGSQDYMSDPLALAQWLRLHYRGEFPTPEFRAIYELLVDTRSQP